MRDVLLAFCRPEGFNILDVYDGKVPLTDKPLREGLHLVFNGQRLKRPFLANAITQYDVAMVNYSYLFEDGSTATYARFWCDDRVFYLPTNRDDYIRRHALMNRESYARRSWAAHARRHPIMKSWKWLYLLPRYVNPVLICAE